jgi:hypothetical protein
MNRVHWVLLVLLLVSGTAVATTTEPWLDVDQLVSPSSFTITIDSWYKDYHLDHIVIGSPSSAFNLRGLGYITNDTGALGESLVTTIYGQALTPVGSGGLDTTGFNALSPEMTPVSGETIIGTSGTEYQSFFASGPTALSTLPSLFPSFDLSYFKGDSSSVVYAFQTFVPTSDLPVPEPLTIVAIGMGIAGLGGYVRRRTASKLVGKTL